MFLKLTILSICLQIALCFPDGAPTQACEDMTPLHGLNQPRPEEMPVDIILERNVIRAGELISVSLRARNDTMFGPLLFRGFMVQAKIAGAGTVPGRNTGTFELTDGARHVVCPTLAVNSVVTHTSNNEKGYIQLLWRAPANIFEPTITVNFYYSIVWMVPMFWVNAVSSPLTIENPIVMESP